VNVSALLEDIVDNQSGTAMDNETALTWGWDGRPMPWITSDHDRLQHVMMNLIGNAVKFTRRGKVSVTARVDRIDGHDMLRLEVADTGIGIDADLVDHVFDDFVVGSSARNREVGGTGLGLGIAKRFVQALGGTIAVESVPGQGSTFTVTLPVTEAEPLDASAPEPVARLAGRALRILLVEDNEINRVVAREMIEAEGHSVVEAHDGQQGLDRAVAEAFDLIFMDINMPVMDGRTATRQIRAQGGASARVPIVALTANAMAGDQSDLLADGMDAVLTKPLSRDALRAVLAERSAPAPGTVTGLVDRAQSAETRQALGAQTFVKLIARFAQEVDDLVDWLGSDAAQDYLEVAARCHKVAGSAAVFGAVGLREQLKQIETAAKTGQTDALRAAMAGLPQVWTDTRPRLT
jgi:CheY-like chemotaxis protein/anti-sigma regulatory factor (Ser/Thr protein kinase)